ncbi:hypothetical protein AAU61_01100 [Desulfocarbo indianensis]|nr:hypothetical protein AAU61_01100 [Desulfocarbo indianensis]
MCGIAGFTHFNGSPNKAREWIDAMCLAQAHRGPDAEGAFIGSRCTLGHRRLSIIDLASGDQPMISADGSVRVVFNGEIYNFRELRAELAKQGGEFRTQSDTEVLIEGYRAWGVDFLSRLNGMFAFALWDSQRGGLLLARDRLGQKPLHYFVLGNAIMFASEIKGLVAHPQVAATTGLDLAALLGYLSQEYVASPSCIWRGIRKLKPGHYIWLDQSGWSERPYWVLARAAAGQLVPNDMDQAAERFWELFLASVNRRLISDVPLGLFLSGGIDSCAVALAAKEAAGQEVRTFSIGFEEAGFDESACAALASQHIGTNHMAEKLSSKNVWEVLPKVLDKLDEPLADASILPTFLLSQFTRGYVTVALSGDGADEFLGGYPTFKAHVVARKLGRLGGGLVKAFLPIIDLLPVTHGNLNLSFKYKWFARGMDAPAGERLLAWLGAFNYQELESLVLPEILRASGLKNDPRTHLAGELKDFVGLGQLTQLYARTYLENDILVKLDRASMLNSLEVRSPFLDPHLICYLTALPDKFKLHPRLGGKALLKKALQGRLPRELLFRPKQGFGVPISSWLSGPLRSWAQDMLSPALLRRQGIFEPGYVQHLWKDHLSKRRDNRKLLWTLLMFQGWWLNYCQGGKTA